MKTITITSGGEFSPPDFTLAAGDFVIFINEDTVEHQPAPVNAAADSWMTDPLPPFVKDQPAATSPALTFDGFTPGKSPPIEYADGLDDNPDRPTGKISF